MPLENEGAAAPVPGSHEYDAAMAAKVDESASKAVAAAGGGELKPEVPARPENVPEEYWDAEKGTLKTEDMLKALADAKGKAEEAPEDEPEKATEKTPEELDQEAKDALAAKGVKFDDFQSEFDKDGKLSDESYAKLDAVGFPRHVVDGYIAGQSALAEQRNSKAYDAAGGVENFTRIQEWAKAGLNKAEIEAFNKAVIGTEEEMIQAVHGIKSRFEKEYGKAPNLLGGAPAAGGNNGYASRAEMVSDMRDARYEKDPAYRAKVQAKIAATTVF